MDVRRSRSGFEKQYMMSTSLYGASMNTAKQQHYGTYHAVGVSHGGITSGSLLSSNGYEATVEAAGLGHGSLSFNHGESVEEGFTVNKFKLPLMITYAEAEAEAQAQAQEHYDEFNRLIMGNRRSNRHVREAPAGGRHVQQLLNNTKKQQLNGGNISFVMRQQQQEKFVSGEHYYYRGHRGGYYWV